MTIISLHLPKTAGTSFKTSLSDHFGASYREDYADQAISKTPFERCRQALWRSVSIAAKGIEGVDCVHGHFLPVKYRALGWRQNLIFITWMREPVARLVSHYNYWQASYDPDTAAPHHRQVIEQRWSLEAFCLSEKFRNIYAKYLWHFPLEQFAFIGISEHYEEDFDEFTRRFLSVILSPHRANVAKTVDSQDGFAGEFARKVRAFHAEDVCLYQRALQMRERRLACKKPVIETRA